MPLDFFSVQPPKQNFLKSLAAAFKGLGYIFKTQRSFRWQIFLALVSLALAYFLKITLIEFFVLLVFITLVLISEITNSALETTLDLVTKKLRFKVRIAKDMAAAAVVLASFAALIFGLIIFGPRLGQIFKLF